MKLKDVTFTLQSPNKSLERQLTWCNKVPKGKRSKPAKIMGIQHQEIYGGVEHAYYQPL